MQLPIVAPAPIVTAHADIFRDLFENRCQFRHFQNYLTGLIVLDNKSLANITRCVLESADKTNLSRFFSEAPWFQDRVQDRRLVYLLQQTKAVRSLKADALLILDDTLCEHVGSLFDYVDRHYNHGDGTYPLAHNPVTSHYVSGPVRFPVDLRLSRRYEELTEWETLVQKHFPGRPIPTTKQDRARLHKEVDPIGFDHRAGHFRPPGMAEGVVKLPVLQALRCFYRGPSSAGVAGAMIKAARNTACLSAGPPMAQRSA